MHVWYPICIYAHVVPLYLCTCGIHLYLCTCGTQFVFMHVWYSLCINAPCGTQFVFMHMCYPFHIYTRMVSNSQGLEGTVEKMSPSLGRNAVYKKVSRISRLPAYLTVQFVRFFMGKAPDTSEMVSKKILKVHVCTYMYMYTYTCTHTRIVHEHIHV